jgi:hypothetical protein
MGMFKPEFKVIGGARVPCPSAPAVQMCLVNWSEIMDDGVALSAHLMTDGEIDDDIDAKIASLEALRPRMKDALRKHNLRR